MSNKKLDQTTGEVEVQEEPKFADSIDFRQLYTVKGLQGIYIPQGDVNRAGFIGICRYEDNHKNLLGETRRTASVKAENLVNLGQFSFYTHAKTKTDVPDYEKMKEKYGMNDKGEIDIPKDMKKEDLLLKEIEIPVILSLKDVFNNFNEYESTLDDDLTVDEFNLENENTLLNLMDIAVPQYDEEKFKSYHLKKCVKWYTWLKQSMHSLMQD